MRHFSRTYAVALDFQLTESILIRRFKSNMLTPNTTSQTYGQRAISHLMSGTIFSICVTSAILVQFAALRMLVLPVAPKRCRKGCHKEHTAASFSTASSSSASNRMGIFRAPSQQGSNLIASAGKLALEVQSRMTPRQSSPVRQKDAKTNDSARKLAAARTNQDLSFQECARTLAAADSEIVDGDDDSEWPNNFHARIYTLMWRVFQIVTLYAAVHLGNDILENLLFSQESATTNSETSVRCDKRSWSGIRKTSKEYP